MSASASGCKRCARSRLQLYLDDKRNCGWRTYCQLSQATCGSNSWCFASYLKLALLRAYYRSPTTSKIR
eukprot:5083599-Pleurochrysis_carterae.AAC.1